jgi:hypothetical protein
MTLLRVCTLKSGMWVLVAHQHVPKANALFVYIPLHACVCHNPNPNGLPYVLSAPAGFGSPMYCPPRRVDRGLGAGRPRAEVGGWAS